MADLDQTRSFYQLLAQKLDELPNGFPTTPDGAELRLLAKLFSPEEANLAVCLSAEWQTHEQILRNAARTGDPKETSQMLKGMVRKGLIEASRTAQGMGFKLMPFVVGIYEMQIGRIDAELARLFEDYYTQAFGEVLSVQPSYHRVIPVEESVQVGLEIRPFESATEIIHRAQAWGVLDCICRTQKALIGEPCEHPLEVCMAFAPTPGAFDHSAVVRPLSREEAHAVLRRAASAGLVHSVSNSQEGLWYLCNCCTCSCGILRGLSDLGLANVVASSPFVNTLNDQLCLVCEACLPYCQFGALALQNGHTVVQAQRCVGCGVCIPACPEGALVLVRRPASQVTYVPKDFEEWAALRTSARQPFHPPD